MTILQKYLPCHGKQQNCSKERTSTKFMHKMVVAFPAPHHKQVMLDLRIT